MMKANVIFFDPAEPPEAYRGPRRLDLRSAHQQTLHAQDGAHEAQTWILKLYNPRTSMCKATWAPKNPEGRWRAYECAELISVTKRASIFSG
jgi:hypothetical protein